MAVLWSADPFRRVRRVLEYSEDGKIYSISKWRLVKGTPLKHSYGHHEPVETLELWLDCFINDGRIQTTKILKATKAERIAILTAKLRG